MTPSKARWLLFSLTVVLLGTAVVLWRFSPLKDMVTPARLAQWISTFKDAPWSPLAVVGIFVFSSLALVPLMVLVAATAVVFDPLVALGVSLVGSLASAAVVYVIGARYARGILHHAFGPAVKRVSDALDHQGMLAVAAIRTVPIAPFTIVNLAAGSIGVRFSDYMTGTALGVAPGLIVLTAFGSQLRSVWQNPTLEKVAVVAGIAMAWIALSILLQKMVSRRRQTA